MTKNERDAHRAEIKAALTKFKADGNKVTECVPHGKPRLRKLKVRCKGSTEQIPEVKNKREAALELGYVRKDGRPWFIKD